MSEFITIFDICGRTGHIRKSAITGFVSRDGNADRPPCWEITGIGVYVPELEAVRVRAAVSAPVTTEDRLAAGWREDVAETDGAGMPTHLPDYPVPNGWALAPGGAGMWRVIDIGEDGLVWARWLVPAGGAA